MSAAAEKSVEFWRDAYKKLTPEEKESIGPIETTVSVKDIQDSVTEGQERARASGLKIKHHGRTIFLHDVFAKVAHWIQEFVTLGDYLVSLDPAHAALPWAAVKVVLVATINNNEKHAVVVEGVEKISQILTFGQISEKLYFSQTFEATQQLKEHLTTMYQKCLQFLGRAKVFCDKHSWERALKAFAPSSFKEDMKDLLSVIEHHQGLAKDDSSLIRAEMQKDLAVDLDDQQKSLAMKLDNLDLPLMRIEEVTQNMDSILRDMENDKVLDWLSDISKVPYDRYHTQIKEVKQVMSGTGKWLLESPTFLEWQRSSTSEVLWLHGTAGTGKSCLLYTLVQQEKDAALNKKAMAPIYFYCARISEEPHRSQAKPILQSLLRQLVATSGSALEVYEKLKKKSHDKQDVTLDDTIQLLSECIRARRFTSLYIDALDECDSDERETLLKTLQQLLEEGFLKVFMTSRNDDNLKIGWLREYPEITVSGNRQDIDFFIDMRIDDMVDNYPPRLTPQQKINQSLWEDIKATLKDRAEGMFQWVTLQLQYLKQIGESNDHEELREKVGSMTSDLKQTYDQILNTRIEMMRLNDDDKARLDCIFALMLVGGRRMDPAEFATLVAAMSGTTNFHWRNVLRLASNFLVHDATFDSFRFAHQSAREYLFQRDMNPYTAESCHEKVAMGCLKIILDENDIYKDALDYARVNWGLHSMFSRERQVDAKLSTDLVEALIEFTAPGSEKFDGWSNYLDNIEIIRQTSWYTLQDCPAKPSCSLFAISTYGLSEVIPDWMDLEPDTQRALSATNNRGQTAFMCAASNGHHETMMQILQHAPKSALSASQKKRVGDFIDSSYIEKVDHLLVLHARCKDRHSTYHESKLRLDDYIMVVNGELQWKDHQDALTGLKLRGNARRARVEQRTKLTADVRQPNGDWAERSLDLNTRIMNSNGEMVCFIGGFFQD